MAITADRRTSGIETSLNEPRVYLAASGTFYAGQIMVKDNSNQGRVTGASSATVNSHAVGLCQKGGTYTNDQPIVVEAGVFFVDNSSSTDQITAGDVDKLCFVADDNRVAKLSTGGRAIAGRVHTVTSGTAGVPFTGVAVLFAPDLIPSGSSV